MATWKNRCPQTFNFPILGVFTWLATDFKSECGILQDLGLVLGNFNSNGFLSQLELFHDMYKMIASI